MDRTPNDMDNPLLSPKTEEFATSKRRKITGGRGVENFQIQRQSLKLELTRLRNVVGIAVNN